MKYSQTVFAIVASLVSVNIWAADVITTDPLTKLPVPKTAAALRIDDAPMTMHESQICKSMMQINFYRPSSGKLDAAVAWYSANLKGFQHTHGYGKGRAQDTFANASGTALVSVAGDPAPDGQNVDIHAVIYATASPGLSEKTIASTNTQNIVCP